MIWQTADSYDHLSHQGQYKCAVCGSGARAADSVIFRPPAPDDFDGFFDICESCIREAAQHLGIAETAGAEHANRSLTKEVAKVSADLSASRDALATVTRENVRLQDVLEELSAPIEEPYGLLDTDEDDDE